MAMLRSILLFAVATLAEIGGAWLVWHGVREHRGLAFVGAALCLAGVAVIMYAPDQLAPANPHRTGSRHGD
jgi:drug/metabolite transporter superfamily protein YnfA